MNVMQPGERQHTEKISNSNFEYLLYQHPLYWYVGNASVKYKSCISISDSLLKHNKNI